MSDVRFVDAKGGDETTVRFQAPPFGEAVGDEYQQLQIWRTKPDARDTGFDLLGDIIGDLAHARSDSEMLDTPILREFGRFGHVVNGYFDKMLVSGRRYSRTRPAQLTNETIATAKRFYDITPAPRRSRVVGTLDMIRASSDSFALRLDDGSELRGGLLGGDVRDLGDLFGERVLVLGTAFFRASGGILRIDAEAVAPAVGEPAIWSRAPRPRPRGFDASIVRVPQGPRSGLHAIVGKWPGEETDEQIEAALRELS
jgi:hypothetical protein